MCSKISNYGFRDAPRVKNPGGQVVLGGDNVSPLVEIGLIDPPKSGGAAAPPASHLVACLHSSFRIWAIAPETYYVSSFFHCIMSSSDLPKLIEKGNIFRCRRKV